MPVLRLASLVLFAFLVSLSTAPEAAAGTATRLVVSGDPLTFLTEADGSVTASRNLDGGVSITFRSGSDRWDLDFAAPQGTELETGWTYTDTELFPAVSDDSPGLSIHHWRGGGSVGDGGIYTVREVVYGQGTEIVKFRATFEVGSRVGEVRINSEPPTELPPRGVFSGYVSEEALTHNMQIAVGGEGEFTGSIRVGPRVIRFQGRFDEEGRWTGSDSTSSITFSLLFTEAGIAGTVDGMLAGTARHPEDVYLAEHVHLVRRWTRTPQAPGHPLAGRYTVVIAPPEENHSEPIYGYGWSTLQISKRGAARLAGRLADGQKFSFGGFVSEEGRFDIRKPLNRSRGLLSGSLRFADDSLRRRDATGSFSWRMPDALIPNFVFFSAGRLETYPRTREVLSGSSTPITARLTLKNKFGTAIVAPEVFLLPGNRVQPVGPPDRRLRLKVQANGCFSGSFNDPVLGPTLNFSGVIHQEQQKGFGFWSQKSLDAPPLSGIVEFQKY